MLMICLVKVKGKVEEDNMGTASTIGYGLISIIGRCRTMEDSFTVFPNLVNVTHHDSETEIDSSSSYDFFAVFDGHGGHKVSNKFQERLHHLIAEEVTRGGHQHVDWPSVMATSFSRMDAEVAEEEVVVVTGGGGLNATKTVGSTALVAVVGKEEIVVANCGDCRALLFRDGVAIPLSHDHLPERPDEKERVEAAGGEVIEDSDCFRVLGVLSTSRSIGDYNLKPYVISEPEVQVTKRTSSDEFLVIATDGIWDVLTNEIVVDLVTNCFRGQLNKKALENVGGSCLTTVASMLVELAMARGSKDNISVILVQLKNFEATSSSFTK